jgi:hypothetical protein
MKGKLRIGARQVAEVINDTEVGGQPARKLRAHSGAVRSVSSPAQPEVR